MKLKPSLFQLIVVFITASLLASCARFPETSQSCDTPQTQQGSNQQLNNCPPSSSNRTGGYSGRYRYGNAGSSGKIGKSSNSSSKVGRGGFGSFGRGGSAGG
ncbi:MAG: hypothetical protein KME22_16450 [Hassallia sp. WJT32-NPBG1]|jgi:uncharacterized membrane protein YgcG|nr:hypothetical protein [Hassallia sp. WJT32-NPBG1]